MNERSSHKGRAPEGARADAEGQRRDLPYKAVKMLADEVVVHLASRLRVPVGQQARPIEVDVELFTHTLLHDTLERATEMCRQERRDGVPTEVIYLHTLAGAARRMGEMWDDDQLSFLDMTVATGRIFAIMRDLRIEARNRLPKPLPDHNALFVTVPGETHTIGVTMVADLLRERGWQITLRSGMSHEELLESIADEHHPVIGISSGHPQGIVPLTRLMVALRLVQPWAYVFIGGGIVNQIDNLKDLIAADAVLSDVDSMEAAMDAMIDLPPRNEI